MMKIVDPSDIISQDEAKEMLGLKPETSNSNRNLNKLVKEGKIRAYQPSQRVRLYSKESIVKYILSTRVISNKEFVPVRIK
jgi:hypothetical protein